MPGNAALETHLAQFMGLPPGRTHTASRARPARPALARDLPAHRRDLSRHRRAGRARAPSRASCRPPCRRPRCATSCWISRMLGLIYAPHTSAGRLPTELGLRFFVDALLEIGDLSAEERRRIDAQMTRAADRRSARGCWARHHAALGPVARRRRRGDAQAQRAAEAYRIRAPRARPRARRPGRRGRLGREPRHRLPPGLPPSALVEASQLSSTPASAAGPLPSSQREIEARARGRQGRARRAHRARSSKPAVASWAGESEDRPQPSSCAGRPIFSRT